MNPETDALGKALLELNAQNWNKDLVGSANGFHIKKAFDTLPKTEVRAAEAIAAKFQGYLSYNPDLDQWYFWDGRIHRPCVGDGLVKKAITEFYKQHYAAINSIELFIGNKQSDLSDEDRSIYKNRLKDYKKFRDSISKASGISSIARLLEHMLDVASDHYDDDRQWFVVENGVYDMKAVRETREFNLLPHDRHRSVYRMWNLREEVGASHSALDKFTSQSIEDEGQAKFLQKIIGTALMGTTPGTRSIVSAQGAMRSGKSMLLRVIDRIGKDFKAEPQRGAIIRGGKNPEHARYPMRDARFVGFTEITDKLDREFILKYSGGDQITSEDKYIKNKAWVPQGVIFLFSNEGMNIDKTDAATYGRIKPIHFPHTFEVASPTGHELDEKLEDKIVEQRAGFLEWIKEGFLMGLEEGFDCTDSMEALKRGERDEEDEAFIYLQDRMDQGVLYELPHDAPQSHSVTYVELYADYRMWHKHSGSGVELKRAELVKKVQPRYGKSSSGAKRFVGLAKSAQIQL